MKREWGRKGGRCEDNKHARQEGEKKEEDVRTTNTQGKREKERRKM